MKISKAEREQSRLNMEEKERRRQEVYEQNKNKPVLDEYYKWCVQEDLITLERDIKVATLLLKNHVSRLQVLILTNLSVEIVVSIEKDIQYKENDTILEYITETLRNIGALMKVEKLSKEEFELIRVNISQ